MKKHPQPNDKKFPFMNRFLSGLVIALAFTLTAFEWTTVTTEPIIDDWGNTSKNNIEEILPPVTYQLDKAKKSQPEKPSNQLTIVKQFTKPDLKPIDDPKPKEPAIEPLAPIDPKLYGKDHFDKVDDNVPYEKVQVFAHYKKCKDLRGTALQTCSQEDIQQQIFKNFRTTPQLKAIGGRQGALMSFVVDKEGNISEITVEQSTSKAMSKAATKAIERLPKFDFPANQQGRNVALRMKIPIVLNLK